MSFPLKEGTGTFPHAALKNSWFDPTKPELFYSHLLIEVVTNCSYDTNWRASNLKYPPVGFGCRTGKECEYLNHAFRNAHIRLERLDIFYGTGSRDIRRGNLYTAPFNYDTIRDRTKNTDVYYLPVPMPTSQEKCIWMLLSFPIRAIYLPRAHYTDNKSNKDRCTYYGLILRQKDLKLKIGPESQKNRKTLHLPPKDDVGWSNLHSQYVVCFDIQKMAARAVLPDELVKDEYQDIYQFIHVEPSEKVEKTYTDEKGSSRYAWYPKAKTREGWYHETTMNMCERGVKLTKVVSKIYGVELKGANEPSEWLVEVLMGCTAIAVGLIPVVGPLAAVGVYVLMEAILKPEVFTNDDELKKQIPFLVAGVLESSKLLRPFLKLSKIKAFQKIAKTLPKHMIQVVKKLPKTLGNNKSVVSKAALAGAGGGFLLLTKTEPSSDTKEDAKPTDKKNVGDENKKRDQDTKKIGGQMKKKAALQASSMPE